MWLQSHDVSAFVDNKIVISPQISSSGFVFQYDQTAIDQIKSLNLDLIIRCGSGILKGDIFNAAKLGILSFHHGDNRVFRGGPAGFWEVLYKIPTIGFIIQRLNATLDGGDVLVRGSFPTASSFILNQIKVKSRSLFHLKKLLIEIHNTFKLPCCEDKLPFSYRLSRSPTFSPVISYFIQQFKKSLNARIVCFFNYSETWSIAFAQSNWRDIVMYKASIVQNPPGRFLADPFLLSHNDKHYCFVEDFSFKNNKGCIFVLELSSNVATFKGTVIEESFHLSFPYIFTHNNTFYMVPESWNSNQIRLYECIDLPFRWKFHSVIMDEVSASDSMIFYINKFWWLFTNINPDGGADHCSELFIFYSKDPIHGPWLPHSLNPVLVDPLCARNGGLLYDNNGIYRVSQSQGFLKYGEQSAINRIDLLTPKEYIENKITSITPEFFPKITGTHHLHSNSKYTVFDFSYRTQVKN